MLYFYCQSYPALNLAISVSLKREIVIITNSKDILKACEFLKIEHLWIQSYSNFDLLSRYFSVRKEIKRIIDIIGSSEFHFTHAQFATFCFILVRKLVKKKNIITFYNFEYEYEKSSFFNLKQIKVYFIFNCIRLLYSVPLELRKTESKKVIALKPSFINNNCKVVNNKDTYYDSSIEFFKKVDIDFDPIKILFVHQPIFNSIPNRIRETLDLINSNDVSIKAHPNSILGDMFDRCDKLPSFLPIEYYYNKVEICIISFYSYALVTASKWKNINVISLIDQMGDDEFYKNVKKDLNEKSGGKIVFISSSKELKQLFTSYKNK